MPLLLLAFVLAFSAVAQNAADSNFSLYQGKIVDAVTGAPLAGTSVKVCLEWSKRCWQGDANSSGKFSLNIGTDARGGRVEVTPIKDGYIRPGENDDAPRIRVGPLLLPPVLRLLALATVSGRVTDSQGKTVPNVVVTYRSTRGIRRDETSFPQDGNFRERLIPGSYQICSHLNRPQPVTSPVATIAVATCLPSNIELQPGETAPRLDIRLAEEPAYSVRGRVLTLVSKTQNWYEEVYAIPDSGEQGFGFRTPVDPQSGEFAIHGLRAGRYTFLARSGRTPDSDVGPTYPNYSAWQPIEVGPGTAPLTLTLRPPVSATLHTFLGGKPDSSVGAYLRAPLPSYHSIDFRIQKAGVGELRYSAVPPATYQVQPRVRPESTYLASVRQDGNEISGRAVIVPTDRSTDIELYFEKSDSFVRVNFAGKMAGDPSLSALVIPEGTWDDPEAWVTGSNARVFKGVLTTEWRIGPLPPGGYFILFVANRINGWDSLRDEVQRNRSAAVHVVLARGETAEVAAAPVTFESWPPFRAVLQP